MAMRDFFYIVFLILLAILGVLGVAAAALGLLVVYVLVALFVGFAVGHFIDSIMPGVCLKFLTALHMQSIGMPNLCALIFVFLGVSHMFSVTVKNRSL